MKEIIINKEFLKNYQKFSITLETCSTYEIDVKNILDIYCVAKKNSETDVYFTESGYIKISALAKDTEEVNATAAKADFEEEFDEDFYDGVLVERLKQCADVCLFSLQDERGKELDIYLPYDPLESVVYHCEIEHSNCPSFTINENGDMLIEFGENSKQPTRKENNFSELVQGWEKKFGDYSPDELNVRLNEVSVFGTNRNHISLCFGVCDKKFEEERIEFVFLNCSIGVVEISFPLKGACKIFMSKMIDGRIYVGLDGLGLDFICDSVLEYDEYCNRPDEDE